MPMPIVIAFRLSCGSSLNTPLCLVYVPHLFGASSVVPGGGVQIPSSLPSLSFQNDGPFADTASACEELLVRVRAEELELCAAGLVHPILPLGCARRSPMVANATGREGGTSPSSRAVYMGRRSLVRKSLYFSHSFGGVTRCPTLGLFGARQVIVFPPRTSDKLRQSHSYYFRCIQY